MSYVYRVSTPTPINIYTRSPCSMLLINFWTDPSSSSDSSAWSAFLWLLFIIVTMFSIISLFLAANGACWATFKLFWVWDFILTLMNWTRGFCKQALQIDDLQIWTSTPDESFASNWDKVGFMESYKEVAIIAWVVTCVFPIVYDIPNTRAHLVIAVIHKLGIVIAVAIDPFTNMLVVMQLSSTQWTARYQLQKLDFNNHLIAHLSATLLIQNIDFYPLSQSNFSVTKRHRC